MDAGRQSAESFFTSPRAGAEDTAAFFGSAPAGSADDTAQPDEEEKGIESDAPGDEAVESKADEPTSEVAAEEEGDEEGNGILREALLCGDFQSAVRVALAQNRLDDALLLASTMGGDLWLQTRNEVFRRKRSPLHVMTKAIVNGDYLSFVKEIRLEGRWDDRHCFLLPLAH